MKIIQLCCCLALATCLFAQDNSALRKVVEAYCLSEFEGNDHSRRELWGFSAKKWREIQKTRSRNRDPLDPHVVDFGDTSVGIVKKFTIISVTSSGKTATAEVEYDAKGTVASVTDLNEKSCKISTLSFNRLDGVVRVVLHLERGKGASKDMWFVIDPPTPKLSIAAAVKTYQKRIGDLREAIRLTASNPPVGWQKGKPDCREIVVRSIERVVAELNML